MLSLQLPIPNYRNIYIYPHVINNPSCKQLDWCRNFGQSEVIKLIFDNFGGYYRIEKPTAKNGKPLYCLQLTNLKAHNFVKVIYPFLRIKKRQAELLLQLRKSLSKGKTQLVIINQKNRWGTIMQFRKYRVSDEDINFRESLLSQIKKLNDSRSGGIFTPKPY